MNHTKTLAIVGILVVSGILAAGLGLYGVQITYATGTFSTGAASNGYSAAGTSTTHGQDDTATSLACTGPDYAISTHAVTLCG
jgi:hypothetical protein